MLQYFAGVAPSGSSREKPPPATRKRYTAAGKNEHVRLVEAS